MSLEKRIKRHVIGRDHEFFAATVPGYERLCAQDFKNLLDTAQVGKISRGGVAFRGRLTDLYGANLHARTALRILMRLARFKATRFDQLSSHIQKIPWELYLPSGALPEIHVTARHSRLYHSGAVAGRVEAGIANRWSDLGATPVRTRRQALFVRLKDDGVTLSLNSSGAPLYQRGIKTHGGHAPLRESTAAAILKTAGFQAGMPLVDPMCGSGTFSLEAAMMAKSIPPGFLRDFAFMEWPAFRRQRWSYLHKQAGLRIQRLKSPVIWASDSDGKVCDRLSECVHEHRLGDAIAVAQEDFFSLRPDTIADRAGLVVLNPPYGRRLVAAQDRKTFYRAVADKLIKDFRGWRVALVVPTAGLAKKLSLPLKPLSLPHGGLHLTLLTGTL